jgi:hypothetical protein
LASIPGWRRSECVLEGSIERRFRLVAHGGRDIRYPLRGRRQRLGSQTQSPSGQVRHRRIRQVTRETRRQRRTGYADFRRELGDGPWVMRAPVKQREALAHDRVSCTREPPRRLIREACTYRLSVSTNSASDSFANIASLPARSEAASSTKWRIDCSSQWPERSVLTFTFSIGGRLSRMGPQRSGSRVKYPHTNRVVAPHHRPASAKCPVSRSSGVLQRSRPGSFQSRRSSGADPRAETPRCRLVTARHPARLPTVPEPSRPRRSDRSRGAARRAPGSTPMCGSGRRESPRRRELRAEEHRAIQSDTAQDL